MTRPSLPFDLDIVRDRSGDFHAVVAKEIREWDLASEKPRSFAASERAPTDEELARKKQLS